MIEQIEDMTNGEFDELAEDLLVVMRAMCDDADIYTIEKQRSLLLQKGYVKMIVSVNRAERKLMYKKGTMSPTFLNFPQREFHKPTIEGILDLMS